MAVAITLNKFEHEVLELPLDEFARMIAYIKMENARQKRAANKLT